MRGPHTKLLAGVLTILGLFTWSAPPPVAAHPVTLLWGSGQYDVLSASHLNAGDQVGMWQAFLFSYNQVPCSKFDGIFGAATRQGTKDLQAFWGLADDGIVGHNTWHTASQWLDMYHYDGYITTFWWPAFAPRSLIGGLGRFRYFYGSTWSWDGNGELPYSSVMPQFTWHSADHPGISFWMRCHPSDG